MPIISQKRSFTKPSESDKENVPASNSRTNSPALRQSKSFRLSDRWPVLNRLLRSTRSGAASLDNVSLADLSGASSSEEDPSDCTGTSATWDGHQNSSPGPAQRVLHPSSPTFPSPLSGACPERRMSLARHSYPHRGHSQSSLYLHRDFWRKRKGDWDGYEFLLYQAGITTEEAYGGIVEDGYGISHPLPPHLKNGPQHTSSESTPRESSGTKSEGSAFLNYSTYPRLGDLSSIRDPFLLSVDTWFSDFPLWTISKLCWIYDVNYRFGHSPRLCRSKLRRADSFSKDFDMSNSSADDLFVSVTDVSDATLVECNTTLTRSPDCRLKQLVRPLLHPEPTSSSTVSTNPIENVNERDNPWEIDWFSRWEVLYNQISLAIDIAASSGNSEPSINASKEAARIILTSSGILYDPFPSDAASWRESEQERESEDDDDSCALIVPEAEDEEDYGCIIPRSESVYRFGAQVDPFTMFATAIAEPSRTHNASFGDSGSSCQSEDFSNQAREDFGQLAIYA